MKLLNKFSIWVIRHGKCLSYPVNYCYYRRSDNNLLNSCQLVLCLEFAQSIFDNGLMFLALTACAISINLHYYITEAGGHVSIEIDFPFIKNQLRSGPGIPERNKNQYYNLVNESNLYDL